MAHQTDTKQRILDATLQLLKKQSNVTIKDITDASFVNVAAVNYHFGDKDRLINQVVYNTIQDFKRDIFKSLQKMPPHQDQETTLAYMLEVLYNFAVENIGIIGYIFVNSNATKSSSNILIKEFVEDEKFINFVFSLMKGQSGIEDENVLFARYMLLFSSFCIPLFLELINITNTEFPSKLSWRNNTELKKHYIDELIKIMG